MRHPLSLARVGRALALLALLPGALAAQDVRVDTRVSPASAQVGDIVVVDITIFTGGPTPEAIDMPQLPSGLRLTGSSDFTEYAFRLPGGRQRTTRRELTITTVAPGHYVIPPIAVRVGGATYRSRPLRFDIAPAYASAPGGAGNSAGSSGDDVLLQSWATPDTVFVGQQVTVRADALFSEDIRGRLAGAPQYDAPSAPGFWVYDLPGNDAPQQRPMNGRIYEAQTFRRAFFPLAAGHLVVPGAHLSYAVRRGFLSGPEYYDLRGDELPVVVRPLPAAGRPASFSGAVGHYAASARVQPANVGAGEAATLTLEVTGEGNIKAVAPPKVPDIAGVEIFPPAEDADVRPADAAVGGAKRFTWVLVPSKPGPLVIPALELPYFDPGQRRYEVARTEPLELTVVPSALAGPAAGSGAASGAALRPLHETDDGAGAAPWVRSNGFLALQGLPLLAFAALVLTRRRRRARPVVRPRGGPAMLEQLRERIRDLRTRAAQPRDQASTPAGEGEQGGAVAAEPGPTSGDDAAPPSTPSGAGQGFAPPSGADADGAPPSTPNGAGEGFTPAPGADADGAPKPAGEGESTPASDDLPAALIAFMREWLAERLGEPALVDTPVVRLDAALREAGVRATVSTGIASLATRLEQARYMPEPMTARECVIRVDEAERLLTDVHAGARKRRGFRLATILVAAALGLAGGAGRAAARPSTWEPAAGPAPDTGTMVESVPIVVRRGTLMDEQVLARSAFTRAVAAYQAGQFVRAAELFDAYTDLHPDHAAAWYDLGNAAYRAGQHGRATWAWLRALELRPRDPDVRQNLALAGTDPTIVDAVAPPVAASRDELLFAAGLAWLVGALVLLARRLSTGKALAAIAGVALLGAALCAGFAGVTVLHAPRAIVLHAAPLMGAPNEHADSLGAVTEGTAVRVLGQRPGWLQVQTPSSDVPDGWVDESRLGRL